MAKEEPVIWRPEHQGHQPPYWQEGMLWSCRRRSYGSTWGGREPGFTVLNDYYVPYEAIHGVKWSWEDLAVEVEITSG
jgi:hypothetical protein